MSRPPSRSKKLVVRSKGTKKRGAKQSGSRKPGGGKRNAGPPAGKGAPRGWDPVAGWYDGWVGKKGSIFHRKVAVPTVMQLSAPAAGERLLDLGCGQGVLAPHVLKQGAGYVGVDASRKLVGLAREHHAGARFLHGDVRRLDGLADMEPASFDAAVFMLSIQDMDPLEEVLAAAAWTLKPGGRLVIFMLHPCFRVPRQSGWGHDPQRKLDYRRVDRYLTELKVPMKAYAEVGAGPRGTTLSFHRPLGSYVNTLAANGLLLDQLREIADPLAGEKGRGDPQDDIPMFAALRAWKLELRAARP